MCFGFDLSSAFSYERVYHKVYISVGNNRQMTLRFETSHKNVLYDSIFKHGFLGVAPEFLLGANFGKQFQLDYASIRVNNLNGFLLFVLLQVIRFAKIQHSTLKYTSANANIFHHTPTVVDLTVFLFAALKSMPIFSHKQQCNLRGQVSTT